MGNILFRNSNVQTLPEVTKYSTVYINCDRAPIIDGRPINSNECNCRLRGSQEFEIGSVFGIREGNYKFVEIEVESGVYFDQGFEEELLPGNIIPHNTNLYISVKGPYINLSREYCEGQRVTVKAVFEHTSNSGVKKICNLIMMLSE